MFGLCFPYRRRKDALHTSGVDPLVGDHLPDKQTLVRLESELQDLIETTIKLEQFATGSLDEKRYSHGVSVGILRRKMRTLRRWHNESSTFLPADLDAFERDLEQSRRVLIKAELLHWKMVWQNIDSEFCLVMDQNSCSLRDRLSSETKLLEEALGYPSMSTLTLNLLGYRLQCIKDDTNQLMRMVGMMRGSKDEASHSPCHDRFEMSRSCSVPSLNHSLQSNSSFENNPEINSVLSLADSIRSLLKKLKDDVADSRVGNVDGTASADIKTLRRQLDKIREWRQKATDFSTDDVRRIRTIVGLVKLRIDTKDKLWQNKASHSSMRFSSNVNGKEKIVHGRAKLETRDTTSGALPTNNFDILMMSSIPLNCDPLDENAEFGERFV